MQTFTAPVTGNYKLEVWGASGGNCYNGGNTTYGGKGGYCSGAIVFPSNFSVYVYVGQSGEDINHAYTFNGGGMGGSRYNEKSGGGATDIRLLNGTWSDFNSLKSRIIVAAGGGGAQHYNFGCNGGNSGGLSGQDGFYSVSPNFQNDPYVVAKGATQTSGGKGGEGDKCGYDGILGVGGNYSSEINEGGGGGGGYYGGGGGGSSYAIVGSGAGGSSFISGYLGCDAIAESSTVDHIVHTGQPNHYSGKVFSNSAMIDGGSIMPKPKGGTETGHSGNGYAIISWISPSL